MNNDKEEAAGTNRQLYYTNGLDSNQYEGVEP